jgi:hypothetical protein
MKHFLTALLLLCGSAAYADEYRLMAATNAAQQITFTVDSLTASGATMPAYTAAVRILCDVSCAVTLSPQSTAPAITQASGYVLAPNVPETLLATGSIYVYAIGVDAGGTLYLQALTK